MSLTREDMLRELELLPAFQKYLLLPCLAFGMPRAQDLR